MTWTLPTFLPSFFPAGQPEVAAILDLFIYSPSQPLSHSSPEPAQPFPHATHMSGICGAGGLLTIAAHRFEYQQLAKYQCVMAP